VRLLLKGGAGAVSGEFKLEPGADRWQPAAENFGKLRGLMAGSLTDVREHVAAVADDIQQQHLAGRLVEAYQTYERAQTLAGAFAVPALAEPVASLEAARGLLPPRWTTPEGYQPSPELDEHLGYPQRLTNNGRILLLVNVPPNDQLWSEISAADRARPAPSDAVGQTLSEQARRPPRERRWYIFYIEAAEPTELVDGDAQSLTRRPAGRELPTTDQWLLAALKLRMRGGAAGFLGGLWEWCLKDAQPWVCGGCDALHAKYLPWPDEQAELAEVWAWLNNALVSQPRRRGDNLAGVRAVLAF
jgi:hypothetical protein